MGTVMGAIKHLQDDYKPRDHIAIIIWTVGDVLMRAKERKMSCTKKQAEQILDVIEQKHSATLGITWDTIDVCLDDL